MTLLPIAVAAVAVVVVVVATRKWARQLGTHFGKMLKELLLNININIILN